MLVLSETLCLLTQTCSYLFITDIIRVCRGWFFHGYKAEHLEEMILHYISVEVVERISIIGNSQIIYHNHPMILTIALKLSPVMYASCSWQPAMP